MGKAELEGTVSRPCQSDDELLGHLTALLFVADEPLELSLLARLLGVRPVAAERAAEALRAAPPAGLMLQRDQRRIKLVTAPGSAEYVRRLRGEAGPQRLSRAALEVLAIVAYRQPATRAEIEAIRGVNSDQALETLVVRGLVTDVGRKDTVGRPVLFGTTLDFLALAGLASLDDLPPVEPVAPPG